MVSFTPGRFTPGWWNASTHWIEGWVGPRAVLLSFEKRKIPYQFRKMNRNLGMTSLLFSRMIRQKFELSFHPQTNCVVLLVFVMLNFLLTSFACLFIFHHSLWSQSLFLPCSFPIISHGIRGHLNLKYNILTVCWISSMCSVYLIPYPQFSCHYWS
jgi:hypothetical protein